MERTQITLIGSAALAIAVIAAGMALAVRADAQGAGYASAPANTPAPMVLSVDASGNALIRGTVVGTTANSISVETWGGTWSLVGTGLPVVAVGDFVGADGYVSSSASMTIDATYVRDWTANPSLVFGVNIPAVPSTLGDALYTGVATEVNATNRSFNLIQAGTGANYTVFLTGNAAVWNAAGGTIPFSSIQLGDFVRLDGVATNYSIVADIVRDTQR